MKQINIILLFTVLMSMVGVQSFAYDAKIDGIYYNLYSSSGTATVTYYDYVPSSSSSYRNKSAYTGSIVIPSSVTYNGKTYFVTSIGDYTFKDCSDLTSVTIPNNVTSVGSSAFYGCVGLKKVIIHDIAKWCAVSLYNTTSNPLYYAHHLYLYGNESVEVTKLVIPNSVTKIGDYAFTGCTGINSISIPSSVVNIGDCAFGACEYITTISIPLSVTSIGNGAFNGCKRLNHITIPPSITEIKDRTFYGCSELVSVYLPSSITHIGMAAFQSCSEMSRITIPENVKVIGASAFEFCSNLRYITILSTLEDVGYNVFNGCDLLERVIIPDLSKWCESNFKYSISNPISKAKHIYNNDNTEIKELVIPYGVKRIGEYAFRYCEGITKVTIPSTVTAIGDYAFSNCIGVKDVSIPASVTSIGNSAFNFCTNLKNITIPPKIKKISNEVFRCTSITNIDIPYGVTTIGSGAFSSCSHLNKVSIPSSVSSIENGAFSSCYNLVSIYCSSEKPVSLLDNSGTFSYEIFEKATLYVPFGSIETYQNANFWKYFTTIKEFNPSDLLDKETIITLTSSGYGTFYNGYVSFILPTGLYAQVITANSSGTLSYKTIANGDANDIIPKDVPVILVSKNKTGGTYTLTSTTENASYTGSNLLHGSNVQTMTSNVNGVSTSGNSNYVYYKLSYGKSGSANANKLGWYWGATNGAAFSIDGGKAWLAIPKTSAQSMNFMLPIDEETGIENVEQNETQQTGGILVNTAGQRVGENYKGMIIRNGKKIMK